MESMMHYYVQIRRDGSYHAIGTEKPLRLTPPFHGSPGENIMPPRKALNLPSYLRTSKYLGPFRSRKSALIMEREGPGNPFMKTVKTAEVRAWYLRDNPAITYDLLQTPAPWTLVMIRGKKPLQPTKAVFIGNFPSRDRAVSVAGRLDWEGVWEPYIFKHAERRHEIVPVPA